MEHQESTWNKFLYVLGGGWREGGGITGTARLVMLHLIKVVFATKLTFKVHTIHSQSAYCKRLCGQMRVESVGVMRSWSVMLPVFTAVPVDRLCLSPVVEHHSVAYYMHGDKSFSYDHLLFCYTFLVCLSRVIHRLVDLVVRCPPRERKIPGSNPACAGIFCGVESYQ